MFCSMCISVNVKELHYCNKCGDSLCRHIQKCPKCYPTPEMIYDTNSLTWKQKDEINSAVGKNG